MQARSINLQKKKETNIFPVRTEQASSIKFLLSWLYFEFPDGTAHLIGETRATKRRQNLFLLRHFCRTSAKIFGEVQQGKGFYLTPKCFLLNIFSRTQISEITLRAVHISGPYSKIRTAQGTYQNAPFQLGPVQPYNNVQFYLYSKHHKYILSQQQTVEEQLLKEPNSVQMIDARVAKLSDYTAIQLQKVQIGQL